MELLFSNPDFAVCIKPVGLDSEHQLPAALTEALGGEILPVHRLDKTVGGVMVFARNKKSAAALSREIQEGCFIKEYLALVHGVPPESGDWEDLLWKDSSKNKVYVVKRKRGGVKEARLTFRRLTDNDPALVAVRLYTGRSHQIRVQFASRGFPLAGDRKYGGKDDFPSPMLYSCRLTFSLNGKPYTFESRPDWAQL